MNQEIIRRDYGDVTVYVTGIRAADSLGRRRAESVAVAALVRGVFGGDHTVGHESTGAPTIRCGSNTYSNISISHSRTHAALAVGPSGCFVGIDIEHNRSRQLRNIARRIFTPNEIEEYDRSEYGLLTAWTLKEAIYKSYRRGELNLRSDVRLPLPPGTSRAMIRQTGVEVLAVDNIDGMALAVVLNRFPDKGAPKE